MTNKHTYFVTNSKGFFVYIRAKSISQARSIVSKQHNIPFMQLRATIRPNLHRESPTQQLYEGLLDKIIKEGDNNDKDEN